MSIGTRVAGRFEIERVAGEGGMGTVYQARDLHTGATVALKLLRDHSRRAHDRFVREARAIAQIAHDGIVRYIAHGMDGEQTVYLAMEWIDGGDLASRLDQGCPMTVREALKLARRVAEALGAAHAGGVVHRDVKPANILLPGGRLEDARLVDFGIARISEGTRALTRTGTFMGTPGYMSIEQARGDRDVDARADVFAVGCVLFECLTGRPAFSGETPLALLAKILVDDPMRVSELVAVPKAVDDLVVAALSKNRDDRPRDGNALAEALGGLLALVERNTTADDPPRRTVPPGAITTGEMRLLSVVLAMPIGGATSTTQPAGLAPTMLTLATSDDDRALRTMVTSFGAQFERLADSSIIVTLHSTGAATDQAARAARCALALRAALPACTMALATGRGRLAERWPVGDAIDKAAALVRAGRSASLEGGPGRTAVRVDDVTAGLLDVRFDLTGDAYGLLLGGEVESVDTARTLLGRQTPCVGRERELAALMGLFEECVSESVARAVLIVSEPGIGKSRLRHEFVRRVLERDDATELWLARGDSMHAGSAFSMLSALLRRALGVRSGEPDALRRQKIVARVSRHVRDADQPRVTRFLGELIGAEFPDDGDLALRAARRDAILMGDQMRRSWEDFADADARAQPLLIVLEDLHWGDAPTVSFIDSMLRVLRERSVFVLAIARPEVRTRFPDLWADRRLTQMALDELSRKSSEKLVRAALGSDVAAATVERLVTQAAGNAFYLEELIRAVAAGRVSQLPETVVAMVHARLDALDPHERRLLRAASVFGEVFWAGGVAALVGSSADVPAVVATLESLVDREVLARLGNPRFPGQREYTFRHGLLRQTAYASLTDDDRALAHRLAGEWLQTAGESDAGAIASHFEQGGRRERAVELYERAALQSLEGNAFADVVRQVERAVACGASGEVLGNLRLMQAEANRWNGEYETVRRCAAEAMQLLPHATPRWWRAAREAADACGRLGDSAQLDAIVGEFLRERPEQEPTIEWASASALTAISLLQARGSIRAQPVVESITRAIGTTSSDPGVSAWGHQLRAAEAMFAGDSQTFVEQRTAAADAFERAGDVRNACASRAGQGYGLKQLGQYAEAEGVLRAAAADAERLNLKRVVAPALHNLGLTLARLGDLEQAEPVERAAVDMFVAQNDKRMEGGARHYLAEILALRGDLAGAEREARSAGDLLRTAAIALRPVALAGLARILLMQGRHDDARATANEALALLRSLGRVEEGETLVLVTHAEVLNAVGERDDAIVSVTEARTRVVQRAERIGRAEWRASFLARVPEHAQALALAAQWERAARGE